MDPSAFDAADPILDEIDDIVGRAFDASPLDEVQAALTKLDAAIGERYSASLTIRVEVFDHEKKVSMSLLGTGLAVAEAEAYRTSEDSTTHRYVVDGEIQAVPHDRCPKCWDFWEFKFENRTCPSCAATLGGNVKLLLDSDVCPNCEEGKVTAAQPVCDKCGHEVDLDVVTWG